MCISLKVRDVVDSESHTTVEFPSPEKERLPLTIPHIWPWFTPCLGCTYVPTGTERGRTSLGFTGRLGISDGSNRFSNLSSYPATASPFLDNPRPIFCTVLHT